MLGGAGDMAGCSRPELYRWKRMEKKPSSKPKFDPDSVEHWIKKVEQASEFAVAEVFSHKKPPSRGPRPPSLGLGSAEQLYDHDDAYAEAQDLLSEWLNTKLKLELASEEEEEEPSADPAELTEQKQPTPEFASYNRFDDLYQHLEQETDSTTAQDYIQQLLHKEVVDSGILDDLWSGRSKPKKQRDPRLTMELRHQQVKENRAKRQQEQERQRQERALRKAALSQAQLMVQEENKKKALKAKMEEEEIQREVVKLRKEMTERRKVMEEARKLEWNRLRAQKAPEAQGTVPPAQTISQQEQEERRKLEKQARIGQMLALIYAENRKCLQTHFSSWYKLVLDQRVKMGKARALADWKLQLKVFRAWRDSTWSSKLERETHKLETDLRDQNRKQQVAQESYQRRLLRHCLVEWQLWSRAEKEKRELEARKEETKRKMAALLDAASSRGAPKESPITHMGSPPSGEQRLSSGTIAESAPLTPVAMTNHCPAEPAKAPQHAWQITREHAALTPEELLQHRPQAPSLTPKRQPTGPTRVAPYGENFEHRHHFQQQLIQEQRRQLEEQKQKILGLMENQRLMVAKQDNLKATALTAALSNPTPNPSETRRKASNPGTEGPDAARNVAPPSSDARNWSPPQSAVSSTRRPKGFSTSPHPAIKAMEGRAAQRAERRKEMEELKRKKEQEKLAQMKAEEEERLRKEAEEKEAQLEKRREEKRLQKQKEKEKQLKLQREQEQLGQAKAQYEKMLLRSWGLEPWKRLVAQSRQNLERAERHHGCVIQRRSLLAWRQVVSDIVRDKRSRAERLWDRILLRRSFRHWCKYKDCLSLMEARAAQRYKASLQRKAFLAWLDLAQEEKMALWEKQRMAAEHSQRRMLLTAFRIWRRFPQYIRDEKLKEERREQLRKRVAEILPDFRMSPVS
ncbi:hypothetical protein XENTR_v10004715 [Xenopus tropicalis]|uniref:Coiled-coil domain containing 191 n=1 Tax=Xenopus tropicalis TaxID=8364 RepID=A0A6I8Q2H3_XENTR|nr:coiled-coil domain-containing protein 191 isoform X2 [Xenopus tropicalis]KAE8621191.1 hypothetical protein XENTR_v10004715 [Xenopus tropicalis]KAE8621192.1 hypothetical protein XENTR_v10004715 [Xenopus tropicalis]|eukprot:XP_004912333.1 PREDICTED: coiled-coil domain-containing protein 191 isoform X2 [Xenopus tropicalis]